jgi:hypothetical protein
MGREAGTELFKSTLMPPWDMGFCQPNFNLGKPILGHEGESSFFKRSVHQEVRGKGEVHESVILVAPCLLALSSF